MPYVIGTDEAGYGPNLGPLVISATVWEVPDGAGGEDLYRLLGPCVAPAPAKATGAGPAPLALGDSKRLYKPGGGLGHLERGLLAALGLLGRSPHTWQQAWNVLGADSRAARQSIPWYAGYDAPIPLAADSRESEPLARSFAAGLTAAGVRLVDVRSRAIFPEEFNGLVERRGSKGALLSHATLALVAGLAESLGEKPIAVTCDKHGGRNRYASLLAEYFPEWLIEIHGEGRARSVYRFGPAERRVECCFVTKAESHLPNALASMASKYLRELAMQALNAFWQARVAGLLPTAGYPQDAQRFRADVAAVQAELGIDDRVLWRMR